MFNLQTCSRPSCERSFKIFQDSCRVCILFEAWPSPVKAHRVSVTPASFPASRCVSCSWAARLHRWVSQVHNAGHVALHFIDLRPARNQKSPTKPAQITLRETLAGVRGEATGEGSFVIIILHLLVSLRMARL